MSFLTGTELKRITGTSNPQEQAEALRTRYGIHPFLDENGRPLVLVEAAIKAQLTSQADRVSGPIVDLQAING